MLVFTRAEASNLMFHIGFRSGIEKKDDAWIEKKLMNIREEAGIDDNVKLADEDADAHLRDLLNELENEKPEIRLSEDGNIDEAVATETESDASAGDDSETVEMTAENGETDPVTVTDDDAGVEPQGDDAQEPEQRELEKEDATVAKNKPKTDDTKPKAKSKKPPVEKDNLGFRVGSDASKFFCLLTTDTPKTMKELRDEAKIKTAPSKALKKLVDAGTVVKEDKKYKLPAS